MIAPVGSMQIYRRPAVVIGVLLLLGLIWLLLSRPGELPIPSNAVTPGERQELERRASAGDAMAQYSLTLLIDDAAKRAEMLKRAADGGYPPALVTYALSLADRGGPEAAHARGLLERAAKTGYYPAITELAACLELGTCGSTDRQAAMSWVVVSQLLKQSSKIPNDELEAAGSRIRATLQPKQIADAELIARDLVSSM
jgi:hypothetical protein